MATENSSITNTGVTAEQTVRAAGNGSAHICSHSSNDPGCYIVSQPRIRNIYFKGQNNSSTRGDQNEAVGGNMSTAVNGTNSVQQGSQITVTGTPKQFRQNPAQKANEAAAGVTAVRASTPKDKPKGSLVSTLASAPASLMRTFSTCIAPSNSKVRYKPTGDFLVDLEGLLMYYYERLSELSIGNIAQRAILLVQAEADRIERQFQQCVDANVDWFKDMFTSSDSPGIGSAVSPSTQSAEQRNGLPRSEVQKEMARVIDNVIKHEREGG